MSPESVADLVDLEQELSSIQRGITQMERITPIEPPKSATEDDPFGDSFTQYPVNNVFALKFHISVHNIVYHNSILTHFVMKFFVIRHIIYCHHRNQQNHAIQSN